MDRLPYIPCIPILYNMLGVNNISRCTTFNIQYKAYFVLCNDQLKALNRKGPVHALKCIIRHFTNRYK